MKKIKRPIKKRKSIKKIKPVPMPSDGQRYQTPEEKPKKSLWDRLKNWLGFNKVKPGSLWVYTVPKSGYYQVSSTYYVNGVLKDGPVTVKLPEGYTVDQSKLK